MINVLPTEEKQSIKKEYYLRLATIHFFFIALMALVASGLLVPSYLYSNTKIDLLKNRLAEMNKTQPDLNEEDLSKIISDINNTLLLLYKGNSKYDISNNVLGTILALRTPGVTFNHIGYIERNDANRIVEVLGIAQSREALRVFQDKLEKDPRIAGVDLPISNFTKRTNIDFKVTIKMK